MSTPWAAPCPLCGTSLTNRTAAGHLGRRHGMALCGVRAEGLSRADVNELCSLYERLRERGNEANT